MPSRTARRLLLTLLAGALALPLWTLPLWAPPVLPGGAAAASPGEPAAAAVGGPLLAGRGLVLGRGAPAPPRDITGRGWLVADLDTGAVLGARDPHGRYLPASTLKTLTALTLLPRLTDRNRLVRATSDDCNVDGTRVGLVPNGHYRVQTLFQCLLMMSGNDCAGALAEANGGIPRTVAEMNAVARHLQALDTHAATPSGLDGPGQSVSAYDLALIMRQALALPDFRRYNTTRLSWVPPQSSKVGRFQFANDNKLLYNYPGVLAAKNGYTDTARHTFVAAVATGHRRLVVTLLHGEQQPLPIWQQVARLVEWGARVPESAAVGRLVEPSDTRPGPGGAGAARPSASTSPGGAPGPGGSGGSGALPGATGSAAPVRTGGGVPVLPIGLAVGAGALAIGALAWWTRRPAAHRRGDPASP